jgi:hypothetical protein
MSRRAKARGFEGPLYRPWKKLTDAIGGVMSKAIDSASKSIRDKAKSIKDKVLGPAKKDSKMLSIDDIVKLNPSVDPGPYRTSAPDETTDKLTKILGSGDNPLDSAVDIMAQKDDLRKEIDDVNKFWDERISDAQKLRDELVENGYKTPEDAAREYGDKVESYKAQRDETIKGLEKKIDYLDTAPSRDLLDLVRSGAYRDTSMANYVRRVVAGQAVKEYDATAKKLVDLMVSKVSSREWTPQRGMTWLRGALDKLEKRVESKYKTILDDVLDK